MVQKRTLHWLSSWAAADNQKFLLCACRKSALCTLPCTIMYPNLLIELCIVAYQCKPWQLSCGGCCPSGWTAVTILCSAHSASVKLNRELSEWLSDGVDRPLLAVKLLSVSGSLHYYGCLSVCETDAALVQHSCLSCSL